MFVVVGVGHHYPDIGFVTRLPTFFVQQGLSVTRPFTYTLVIVLGSPIGCAIGAFATSAAGPASSARRC